MVPPVVKVVSVIVVAMAASLFLLDRLLLWMESRGWVYWRRTKRDSHSAGTGFLEIQSLLEPGKRYVLEARHKEEAAIEEEQDQGDGDRAGE